MWNDLLAALALVFVIEGILPFVKPDAYRRFAQSLSDASDSAIRWTAFLSMVFGLIMLAWVR